MKRRIEAELDAARGSDLNPAQRRDAFLAKLCLDEVGVVASATGRRCSDKGFLPMAEREYFELLDWTARQLVAGNLGITPGFNIARYEPMFKGSVREARLLWRRRTLSFINRRQDSKGAGITPNALDVSFSN